jgi:2,4-dienoyl-CoA reductase-like NADH-dependent reductase (Old Yellow Enzyme family)
MDGEEPAGTDIAPAIELLASPAHAGTVGIQNRLVAQPMEHCSATPEGEFSPELVQDYEQLAGGNWGALYLEASTVCKQYKSRLRQLVIDSSTQRSWKKAITKIKAVAPGSKIIAQLTFPGTICGEGLQKTTIIPAVSDSDPAIKLITDAGIEQIKEAFYQAIDIAIGAGVDGLDLKACHGYLGIEFLRPANTRPSKYGGTFENRVAFLRDLFVKARESIEVSGREGLLLGSRVSVNEYIVGGFGTAGPEEYIEDLAEPKQLASLLAEWGANFINVTAGIPAAQPEITRPTATVPWGIWNHFRLTKEIKMQVADRDVLVIGSAYSMAGREAVHYAAKNISTGIVDAVGFGRQALADPLYAAKLLEGRLEDIQYCTGCNSCAKLMRMQRRIGCAYYNADIKKNLK